MRTCGEQQIITITEGVLFQVSGNGLSSPGGVPDIHWTKVPWIPDRDVMVYTPHRNSRERIR